MNRKIKLSLITLLSVGCISVASLPLVSCSQTSSENNEITPSKENVKLDIKTKDTLPSIIYINHAQKVISTLIGNSSNQQKIDYLGFFYEGNDLIEKNILNINISSVIYDGEFSISLTAKDGYTILNNAKVIIKGVNVELTTLYIDQIHLDSNGSINMEKVKQDFPNNKIFNKIVFDTTVIKNVKIISADFFNYFENITILNKQIQTSFPKLKEFSTGNYIEIIENGVFYNTCNNSLYGDGIQSLNLGESVISIGDDAFRGNNLNSLDLSKNTSLTSIGHSAFRGNNLNSLDLSKNTSLTSIGGNAFEGNWLTSLTLNNTLQTINYDAFRNNRLINLNIPNSVVTIEIGAFSNNRLINLNIPNSVVTIGMAAFSNNKLISLTLGHSVTTISDNAFEVNKLGMIDSVELKFPESLKTIGNKAFSFNNFGEIGGKNKPELPNHIISVGNDIFEGKIIDNLKIMINKDKFNISKDYKKINIDNRKVIKNNKPVSSKPVNVNIKWI